MRIAPGIVSLPANRSIIVQRSKTKSDRANAQIGECVVRCHASRREAGVRRGFDVKIAAPPDRRQRGTRSRSIACRRERALTLGGYRMQGFIDTAVGRASESRAPRLAQDWRPDFSRIRGHVAFAIADQIEEAIRAGLFRPGDRLPSQQAIADSLGFHPNTVYAAFREVARRGLIKGFAGRGTLVLDYALS
ncbi:winged helix-turn-helix domain-containing protein [Burkholderia gladioli]|uniref:winged helix-turn-helix domain-containing protein n=1 Tax=Burkholderia gladioli TaxID=28095 RepID=UPI002650F1C5|nr:winged helix-turn-helix domain-containing protein [Burkholderia gladioli]MDN7751225.1 winged helix-turn-helix domain-containing protein [Burkholderia gladioli]